MKRLDTSPTDECVAALIKLTSSQRWRYLTVAVKSAELTAALHRYREELAELERDTRTGY